MLQLAAIVLVGISAALSGFIITDSIAPQRTPAETAVAAVASVDLSEPTTVTNLPVFEPVEFEAVPGAGFPTAAPVQQPVAVIPSPVADTSLVQALAATVTTLAAQFGALEKLEGRLSGLEARPVSSLSPAVSGGGAAAPVYVNTHGLTQKIDRLENTTITNATISGGSVTAASILGTITNVIDSAVAAISSLTADMLVATNATFTNSTTTNATTTTLYTSNLTAAAANVTGDLTVSGTITGGTLSVSGLSSGGAVEAPYFTATSTTATSSFAGGLTAGTNGLTVLQNGNVGIGTTAPATVLQVNGASNTTDTLTLRANTNNGLNRPGIVLVNATPAPLLRIGSGSTDGESWFNALGGLHFGTGNAAYGINERLTILTSGNVGIGTTTPSSTFHIYNGASGLSPLGTAGATIESNANVYLNLLTAAGQKTGLLFGIGGTSNVEGAIIYNDPATARGLQFRTAGNNTRMVVNSTGNVGIGTTSPFGKLHVYTGASTAPGANSLADEFVIEGSGNVGLSILTPDSTGVANLYFGHNNDNDAGRIVYNNSNDSFDFFNSGTQSVKITGTGNVGIGSTSPMYKFTVGGFGDGTQYYAIGSPSGYPGTSGGVLELTPYFGSAATPFGIYVDNGGNNFSIGQKGATEAFRITGAYGKSKAIAGFVESTDAGATYAPSIVLDSTNDDETGFYRPTTNTIGFITDRLERGRFDSSGNLGIGTTSPWAKLSVSGSSDLGTSALAGFFIATNTAATSTFAGGITGPNNFVVQSSSGRVGIGTTSPAYPLTIAASIAKVQLHSTGGNAAGVSFGYQTLPETAFIGTSPAGGLITGQSAGDLALTAYNRNILFSTANGGNSAQMFIGSNGNIGIGTTTPSHTLSVAGTVGFDGLTGATGAGSLCLDASKQVVYNAGSDACLPSLRDTKHDILALSLSGIDTIEQLEPVSFIYNEGDGRVRLGFIAENTAAVHSELATYNAAGAISGIDDRAVLSVVVKAIKEVWARILASAETDARHDTEIAALNARIANLEVQLGAASVAVPTASTATIELLVNGNNPALLTAGESYVDLGATASSSDTTVFALGIRTFVDGTAVETVVLDTSITATTTITYRVIDGDGAVLAEAERTVVVSDPAQSELPAEQTTDEPIEPMSNN